MTWAIFTAHLGLRFTQLLREPGYVVSTMIFPALFFLIFAHPNADTEVKARFLMASFSAFAILGVCFFQFGVHHASEIRSGWHTFLRTLPVTQHCLFIVQWLSAAACGILAVGAVLVTVTLSTAVEVDLVLWLKILAVLLMGAIPFALISAGLARWVSGWAALPIFNLIYILSSFAGGLWLPPNALPSRIESLSHYLPTRHLAEVAWKVALQEPVEWKYVWALVGFTIASLVFLRVSRIWAPAAERI